MDILKGFTLLEIEFHFLYHRIIMLKVVITSVLFYILSILYGIYFL